MQGYCRGCAYADEELPKAVVRLVVPQGDMRSDSGFKEDGIEGSHFCKEEIDQQVDHLLRSDVAEWDTCRDVRAAGPERSLRLASRWGQPLRHRAGL